MTALDESRRFGLRDSDAFQIISWIAWLVSANRPEAADQIM
jgi:hypothetical protein